MFSFMGQGQLGKLDKLAAFSCWKRISKNPNWLSTQHTSMLSDMMQHLTVILVYKKEYGDQTGQPHLVFG